MVMTWGVDECRLPVILLVISENSNLRFQNFFVRLTISPQVRKIRNELRSQCNFNQPKFGGVRFQLRQKMTEFGIPYVIGNIKTQFGF